MAGVKATLDDKPLLATADVGWILREGVYPEVRTFDVAPGHATALLTGGPRPVDLVISNGLKEVKIEKLYVISGAPGPNPEISRVVVVDRRYWWTYVHVLRRFNVRRRTGFRRVNKDDVRELTTVNPSVWYAPYSLPSGNRDAAPWTPGEAISSLMVDLFSAEPVPANAAAEVQILGLSTLRNVPMENVELDDNGADALRRLISGHLPDMGVTVEASGKVLFYSKADGAERKLFTESTERPTVDGFGFVDEVKKRIIRPKEVHVLFTREAEIRADFVERAIGETVSIDPDSIFADNVLPNPDYDLVDLDKEPISQGTWLTFSKALQLWSRVPLTAFGTVGFDALRAGFVPGMDLWATLKLLGTAIPDADWASRLAMLQQHYRRTFRINPRFMERLFSIAAHRIGTIDPVFGTRAPAVAYANWSALPGDRMHFSEKVTGFDLSYIVNVQSYPANDIIGVRTKPAPARVTVVDMDQGIVHLDFAVDPSRTYTEIMPSAITQKGKALVGGFPSIPGPSADLTDRQRPVTFNAVIDQDGFPEYTKEHKVSIILTAIPGSPNNDDQFVRIVVKPSDVADMLPLVQREGLSEASGPIQEIRVGAGMETARQRWLDAAKTEIYNVLGIGNDEDKPKNAEQEAAQDAVIKGLIINLSDDVQGAGSLERIARAAAALVYAQFADRVQGFAAFELDPNLEPGGRMSQVEHRVTTSGIVMTQVTIPEEIPQANLFALLPNSTRRLLMRLAMPGRANQ